MAHWNYTTQGPDKYWRELCQGVSWEKQSPINIETAKATRNQDLGNLKADYESENNAELINNGHSIQCNIQSKSVLSGGPLKGEYRLEQFHLHWGSSDDKGSEHTIDGKHYSAELHLVHYNMRYANFKTALDDCQPDSLAVLGVMIEVGSSDNIAFQPISQVIGSLKEKGSGTQTSGPLSPDCLLPNNQSAYWTYSGSLTTPPLLECVRWILFKEPIQFSRDQLNKLRTLKDEEGHAIQDNFRPPVKADIKDRPVEDSFT